jgi:large subunit ribosomal protein L22
MKAYLKNYRQSPRKVRLVADMIRGKSVSRAQAMLSFTDNKSAPALKKLVDSAASNARSQGKDSSKMMIKEITVDLGTTMKRIRPMSRGRANQFRKRSSKILIVLGDVETKTAKGRSSDQSAKQIGLGKKEKKSAAKEALVKNDAPKKTVKKVAKKAPEKAAKK